jgi:ATP-dependent RNA helicase HelY
MEEVKSPADKFAAAQKRTAHPITQKFVDSFDFAFDDFQIAACNSVEDGHGVLVAAPTGAGKTVVGEFAAYLSLQQGKKCFYTTPIKALSNQKYQEFVERFGNENVGLLTGDTNINSEAPVLVMTTEVLRNMLYQGSSTLTTLGSVVMDEVHYLADKFRGAVWEEVLILSLIHI